MIEDKNILGIPLDLNFKHLTMYQLELISKQLVKNAIELDSLKKRINAPKPKDYIFPQIQEAINKSICVLCFKEINKFSDQTSNKEYFLSGLCEKCQKKIFKKI